jgi:phosphohistidine phosphatase SixA
MNMITTSRRFCAGLCATAGLALGLALATAAPARAQAQTSQAAAVDFAALAKTLRAGGLVILVRHGATFSDQADQAPVDFADVTRQRNLNDKGKELARAFGAAIRAANVPVGAVYTSEFNRAYETAVLAGFTNIKKTADLTEGGLIVSPDENARRAKALVAMLGQAPQPGTNTVIITHKPNVVDALGKDWFDVQEGEASIFMPMGAQFHLVARLQMADWPRIAAAAK